MGTRIRGKTQVATALGTEALPVETAALGDGYLTSLQIADLHILPASGDVTGVTDTATINAAIAALGGAGTLLFGAATYYVLPAAITAIPSKTHIKGAGIGLTEILWAANSATTNQVWYTFIAANAATDIEVDGITFNGNRNNGNHSAVAGAENFDALWFSTDNQRINVHHCRFTNFRGDSMYVTRSAGQPKDVSFCDNTVDNCGWKEVGDGGNPRQGIAFISCDDFRICRNFFSNLPSMGVDLEADTVTVQTFHDGVVSDNHFDSVASGAVNLAPLAAVDAVGITIANNTVSGAIVAGFNVFGSYVSVSGNVVTAATTYGVLIKAGSNRVDVGTNILRVTGTGAGVAPVYVDSATYCTVACNVLLGTTAAAGINEAGTSDLNVFGVNVIDNATRYVITGGSTSAEPTFLGGSLQMTGLNLTGSGGYFYISASGGVLYLNGTGQMIFNLNAGECARFDASGNLVMLSTRKVLAGALGVGNSAAASVAVGTLANKIEVFDQAGSSLGFVPVYTSIT